METSHDVVNVYSCTASLVAPEINIFSPDLLNAMPEGKVSSLDKSKESTNDAEDTSHATDNVYSFTSSLTDHTINIFSPDLLNAIPVGKLC